MRNYNDELNDEIMDSMSEPINQATRGIKSKVNRGFKKSLSRLGKKGIRAGARLGKAIAKALLATLKVIAPYAIVVVAVLIFFMFAYFVIFEFTGTEKEYIKEFENKIERREDGVYITTTNNMNAQNTIISDYYKYFAGQSFWKLIHDDNETIYSPDEKKEVKDEYNRENLFLLPSHLLYSLDEHAYNWKFKYAEQFIFPVHYDKEDLSLLSLTDEDRLLIAESKEQDIETGELTGNNIISVKDYGLASVLKYNEKEDYYKVKKIKGDYIAKDVWNSETKEVERVSYSEAFDIEIEDKEDIWLIDKAVLFTGEIEYEYEYEDLETGKLRPGESTDEKSPVLDIIVFEGEDPNCETVKSTDPETGESITSEVCNPIPYTLKKYRDPESITADHKPVVAGTNTNDKGQDYFYDYLYNFESYIPTDAITKFDLEDRIDYDSYVFDYDGILTDDYGFDLGSGAESDKFLYAMQTHWDTVLKYSLRFGVDPYLTMAVLTQESGGKNLNEFGVMQLYNEDLSVTITNANNEKETVSILHSEKLDFDKNIMYGTAYLKRMLEEFENPYKALQSYNFGPNALRHVRRDFPEAWESDFGWLLYREYGRLRTYPGTRSLSYKCMAFPEGVPLSTPRGIAGDSCYLENVLQYYVGDSMEKIDTPGGGIWDKLTSLGNTFGDAFMALILPRKHEREEAIPKVDYVNYLDDSRIKDVLMTTKSLDNQVLFSESDNEDFDNSLNFWEDGFMDVIHASSLELEELMELAPPPDGHYVAPITNIAGGGGRISSFFGLRERPTAGASTNHGGVDIAIKAGTPIIAVASGKVIASTSDSSSGNYVKIDHGNGIHTLYMHMRKRLVSTGAIISQGDIIGEVGTTGASTGNHLHFEMRVNETKIDPKAVVLIGN